MDPFEERRDFLEEGNAVRASIGNERKKRLGFEPKQDETYLIGLLTLSDTPGFPCFFFFFPPRLCVPKRVPECFSFGLVGVSPFGRANHASCFGGAMLRKYRVKVTPPSPVSLGVGGPKVFDENHS